MTFRRVVEYVAAIAIAMTALSISLIGRSVLARSPSDLFFAGVALSASLGGLGPAVLASILSVLALDYFFLDPLYEIDPWNPGDIISLLAFLVVAVLVSALSVKLRRDRDRAEVARAVTEASSQERDSFIRMAIHELRGPMTSIRGYAAMLATRSSPPPRASEIIVRQTARLDRLADNLLATSALGDVPFSVHPVRTDLFVLIGDAIASARQRSELHAIQLFTSDERVEGYWDRDRIAQVIENLLANAIKHSPEGGTVGIHVDVSGDQVKVSIRDDGPGMRCEALSGLFERFYRGDESAALLPGQGLGLYISRQIVESHGGQLWAESDGPGSGNVFTFVLPVGEPVSADKARIGGDTAGSQRIYRVPRISGASRHGAPTRARTSGSLTESRP